MVLALVSRNVGDGALYSCNIGRRISATDHAQPLASVEPHASFTLTADIRHDNQVVGCRREITSAFWKNSRMGGSRSRATVEKTFRRSMVSVPITL